MLPSRRPTDLVHRLIPSGSLRRGRAARRRWHRLRRVAALGLASLLGLPAGVLAQGQVGQAIGRPERIRPVAPPRQVAPPPRARLSLPGAESFAVPPKTPLEQWDAASYLLSTGQVQQAIPYLNAFLKSNPDDATLIQVRDQYGLGSILQLSDHPETQALAEPLLKRVADALRRRATDPARLETSLDELTGTPDQQALGIDHLRQAGPQAVPAIVRRLARTDLSPEQRALLVRNLGRLDARAVPALIAALDAPRPQVGRDVADVLGQIGDRRAVVPLTYAAARPGADPAAQQAASQALARLSPQPPGAPPRNPAAVLAAEALKYHRHQVQFPGDSVELWAWKGDAPAASVLTREAAEASLARKYAQQAVQLDPSNRAAQLAQVSVGLDQAARSAGQAFPAQDPTGAYQGALAAGPEVLTDVLRNAIADGHPEVGALAARALAEVAGPRNAGLVERPLVEALDAPDRRIQLAAAEALVNLEPRGSFPGASKVVPVLSRFSATRPIARPVVIDGNLRTLGNGTRALQALGYDPQTASDGKEGFRLASESADVEFILLDPIALQGAWSWTDTLVNLRADARTAGIPVFVNGALGLEDRIGLALSNFPRTAFVVAPTDPVLLQRALERELPRLGVTVYSPAERAELSQRATNLLARIAQQPGSPFAADLPGAERALEAAMQRPETESAASSALADVPNGDAQQKLAETLLDASRPLEQRQAAGRELVRSLQRFGPVVGNTLERNLAAAVRDPATDPALRPLFQDVLNALQPDPTGLNSRYRGVIFPGAPAAPAPAPAATGVAPAPPRTPPPPAAEPRPAEEPEAMPAEPEPEPDAGPADEPPIDPARPTSR